jgi:hypothetical protein
MLIGEEKDWLDGVERAWDVLTPLNPEGVCRRAKADFDESAGHYILPLFNEKAYVSIKERRIWGDSKISDLILNELSHYSILAVLWYLIQAKDINLSGNLINPREVKGGLMFTKGTHVLPLDKLVEKYNNDIEQFVNRGISLGGEVKNYGDASVRLFPFPRVPMVLIIWKYDKEFLSCADILLDSTCGEHLPTDIIWSTAMMSILLML